MSLKYMTVKKRTILTLIPFSKNGLALYLGICLFWLGFGIDIQAQTMGKKDIEINLSEMGVTVTTDDVKRAKIKDEEVKTNVTKSMDEINSSISNLVRDRKAMDAYLERLRQEKADYLAKEVSQKFLELLDKEIAIVKEKTDIDNEQIETYKDRIEVLHDQSKAYDEIVVLLKSILRLEETLLTSHEQVPIVKKEADIAKSYITAVQASIREKESVISFFMNRLEEIKAKVSEDERDLAKYLESLKTEIGNTELAHTMQEKIDSILLWKKAIGAQWIAIFETRLGTSRIRYDKAQQELKNAEFNAAFLAEKATRLEERLREEELIRKQAELEAAKRAEEESRKIAERTKAEVEKALQEAARKSEEIVMEQMTTTSPEKKRLLELEAEVHKQVGLIAKRKDELITEGAQIYKDFTEYKKLEADIGLLLSKGGTTKEIDESLIKIETEMKRFSEAITAVESLLPLVKEEKKLISENIVKSKEEIAKIENEAASFTDKELARQAIEHANHIMKMIEEQSGLISTRLDRLQERLKIKKKCTITAGRDQRKIDYSESSQRLDESRKHDFFPDNSIGV